MYPYDVDGAVHAVAQSGTERTANEDVRTNAEGKKNLFALRRSKLIPPGQNPVRCPGIFSDFLLIFQFYLSFFRIHKHFVGSVTTFNGSNSFGKSFPQLLVHLQVPQQYMNEMVCFGKFRRQSWKKNHAMCRRQLSNHVNVPLPQAQAQEHWQALQARRSKWYTTTNQRLPGLHRTS